MKTEDRTLSPKHKRSCRAWPHYEVSRLLDAIECLHAQDSLTTFHLGVFKAIAALVEDVELTMDRIPLVDGKLESRHTQEGVRDAGTAIFTSEIDSAEPYVTGGFPWCQGFDDNYRFRYATRVRTHRALQ